MTYSNFISFIKKQELFHLLSVLGFYSALYIFFFSPVLFSRRLLAPGDGFLFHLPNFLSGIVTWDPQIAGGFPVAADMQSCAWYPPWHFFRLFNSWNGFVVSAYVLSACFTYGYCYLVTKSKFASLISGIIYSMSGFMLAHLGHTTVIHGAIWLPLFIWALHRISERFQWSWFAVASFSVAFSLLCGHPQIPFYTLVVGAVYVFVLGITTKNQLRLYVSFAGIVIFALALAAIQLFPSYELLQHTLRLKLKYSEFITYSVEPYHLLQFIFPNLLGGSGWPFYNIPYFGTYSQGELTSYVGLLPLLLTVIASVAWRGRTLVWLWIGIALFALLMALGDQTPLGKIIYHVPIYNKFRAPARHFILLTFAVSVLSGFGIAAIQTQLITWKSVIGIVLAGILCAIVFSWSVVLMSSRFNDMAESAGLRNIKWVPWTNMSIGLPLILFLFSTAVLIFWFRGINSFFKKVCLISVLLLDLAMFGWFREWRTTSPSSDALAFPVGLERYKTALQQGHQRLLPFRGNRASRNQALANVSRLWGIPSASIYTPMMMTRTSELLSMTYWGAIHPAALLRMDRSLDLMAVRYLTVSQSDIHPSSLPMLTHGLWSTEDAALSMGACGKNQPSSIEFALQPMAVTNIGIVSNLGCSTRVPDDREVLRISATDNQGKVQELNVLAGRDTSEWAIDCTSDRVLHRRANVFQSYPYRTKRKDCKVYTYVAKFSVAALSQLTRLKLEVTDPRVGISLRKLSLWNAREGLSYQIPFALAAMADKTRWRKAGEMNDTVIYENRLVKERAWLVPFVLSTSKILEIIKSSRMPNGEIFRPSKVALVEDSFHLESQQDKNAEVFLKDISNRVVEVTTKSDYPSFLVLSDIYYPGWKASVDGKETHVHKTNYIFRGVSLPAGKHLVKFEYKPTSLYIGAAVSILSLFVFAIIWGRRSNSISMDTEKAAFQK